MSLVKIANKLGLSIQDGETAVQFLERLESTYRDTEGGAILLQNSNDIKWIPKARFDEVNIAKGELENTVRDLEEVQKKNASSDLVEKIAELEKELSNKDRVFDLKTEAMKLHANDVDDVLRFIDIDSVEVKEDGSSNLIDKLAELKQNKPYLFAASDSAANTDQGNPNEPNDKSDNGVEGDNSNLEPTLDKSGLSGIPDSAGAGASTKPVSDWTPQDWLAYRSKNK